MGLDENQVNNDRRLLGYVINGNPDATNDTLQFDNVKKEFTWVPSGGGGGGLSEFEYLARVARGDLPNGVLKEFQNSANGTGVIGTVPAGKDWYLVKWSVTIGALLDVDIDLEYPTGTKVDSTRSNLASALVYPGIAKGFKIVATDTVTIVRGSAISNVANMTILEVNTGDSIVIP